MVQGLAQPVATNVFETFRDDDNGIEAPHRWGHESPVGLLERVQNGIAYAE
jgi:hypothetical protein